MIDLVAGKRLFVFPHPDDEVFSCLALWRRMSAGHRRLHTDAIWLTTGCPARERFTRNDDYTTYRARLGAEFESVCQELRASLLGSTYALPHEGRSLHLVATEVYLALESLVIAGRYQSVFCCPLEGAHPDHDVANALVGALRRANADAFDTFEYASYHLGTAGFVNNVFLQPEPSEFELRLNEADVQMKQHFRKMYTAEPSLDAFETRPERFRPMAHQTDLSAYRNRPLYYETWSSGIDPHDIAQELTRWARK